VGLFSGSKSSSTNSTTNNSSTSLGIDGDLSGILGDGNTLATDNSQTDIYTDNSDNSSLDWQQDNSDNSIREFEGQLSGSTIGGNVTMTADGAFQFGSDVVKELGNTMQSALNNATEQTYLATKAAQETAADALAFGGDAIRSVENTSLNAIDGVRSVSEYAIQKATDSTMYAGETISNAAEQFAKQNQATTAASIEAANTAMERNAALIQTTALGGQDLMIDAMKKVLMAGAAMMAVVFAVSAYKGAKS
jgi:glucan-binding YG repeat protein